MSPALLQLRLEAEAVDPALKHIDSAGRVVDPEAAGFAVLATPQHVSQVFAELDLRDAALLRASIIIDALTAQIASVAVLSIYDQLFSAP